MNSKITIKKSTRDDWDYILELRNNTRQFYGNTNILTKDEHYAYLEKANVTIWIAYYGNGKMGFLIDQKLRNNITIHFQRGPMESYLSGMLHPVCGGVGRVAVIPKCNRRGMEVK